MDRTGLGYQTRNLVNMLKPAKVMAIDSRGFNGSHVTQHPDWFEAYQTTTAYGFPNYQQQARWLQGLTHVVTCEIPYGYNLFARARQLGVKTVLQVNPEFFDYYQNSRLPEPDLFLAPSAWHQERLEAMYPGRVKLLPPPTFHQDFTAARENNLNRTGKRRLLHVVGRQAIHDRNGTMLLLEALKHTSADFELVVKSQSPLQLDASDHRVRYDYSNPNDQGELYEGFDALIMSRRYGGLCLPVNEALMSALPVVMTDVSPNNQLLPAEWLVPAVEAGTFMTRTEIEIYNADPVMLAAKIDELCGWDDTTLFAQKALAFDLGYSNFAADVLRTKYQEILSGIL
jgi:glycosyltransferase involved in cell wall biosynthesis